ncbi:DUF2239 family protein [Sagittula salina]|uniref:DUF2239 family protein n=1 Tax=Sagittula salina TaxID=2820268 RepID=A0A940MMH6_9RHOB|nr:DUF2239 family protein [Sagittula salina]MBP0482263.1 DUF2239 family protein [Sagittula salina]
MSDSLSDRRAAPATAFAGDALLCRGSLLEVALAVRQATGQVFVFDDASGRVVDLDLRGADEDIAARLAAPPAAPRGRYRAPAEDKPPARGRPKLGVVAREVTLLPKHWEWLATQKGGASATLRRLVGDAMKAESPATRAAAAREAAHGFARTMAEVLPGGLPGYDEVMRALFAGDRDGVEQQAHGWPEAVRAHVLRLGFGD